eukprot:CAMPEP_0118938686 /NCGR_PEP_ID=MMETSP1169-20130426/26781_1 /TAXON_ID=36882 /ORGANISM="Pyramimonas obovata, Strain CCMP722" /LENGTH=251 /DNA_ID=CAMNT_0006882709 /DNA_START=357 /DNA_END=1109 /DNA_ORIENTATION=+
MDTPKSPPSSKETGNNNATSTGSIDNADAPASTPSGFTLPSSSPGALPSGAAPAGLDMRQMTRLTLNSNMNSHINSNMISDTEETMRKIAAEVAHELLVGVEGSAGVVAASLRAACPVWAPPALAALVVELDEAVAAASERCGKDLKQVPVVVAAVASELAKGWDHDQLALCADLIALHHGWGRGSDILHELLRRLLGAEKGIRPASNEYVDEVAGMAAALKTPPQRWTVSELTKLLKFLLPADDWDSTGL